MAGTGSTRSTDTVIVLSGGPSEGWPSAPLAETTTGAVIIAADSGADHARALGLVVDHVVGDFDSISPEGEQALAVTGTPTTRVSAEKDATDLELALDEARRLEPRRLLVLGSRGGRLDHELATLLLLGSPRFAAMDVRAHVGQATVTVIRHEATLDGEPGELVSLLALHGPARAVSTSGLSYPLRGEDLEVGSTRGVSNTFLAGTATVSLTAGVVLAIQPEPEEQR